MQRKAVQIVIVAVATLVIAFTSLRICRQTRQIDNPPAATADAVVASYDVPETERFKPQVVIPQRFEPITEFELKDGPAGNAELTATELVLGVVLNGQARAYPINMLTGPQREIINDTLGDTPIAATW